MSDEDYPRFSETELDRRRNAVLALAEERSLDGVLVFGANRAGSAIQWLSEWPVTREASLVITPDDTDSMWVQFYNHLPNARRFARRCEVAWDGPQTWLAAGQAFGARGARRIGLIGPLGWKAHAALSERFEIVGLDAEYTRLRLIKSDEELEWMRRGAELSDRGIEAVRDGVRPGMAETELGAICEAAFLDTGATNHIHYFGATSMSEPAQCVPSQWPSNRILASGDVLTCEISASWWGYAGQVLRSMTIDAAPTQLYLDLHAAADAAFDAICGVLRHGTRPEEVIAAAGVIEDAGFTIYDDLVHGYGGGYFPPILGTQSRMNEPLPDMVFEKGMTVVVQPNVITTDERAGVQTGGLVQITDEGVIQLQQAPRGFWRT
jgi:Xaa-Pro aminopeptidase